MEICGYDQHKVITQWYEQVDAGVPVSKVYRRKVGKRYLWWFRAGKDLPKTKLRK